MAVTKHDGVIIMDAQGDSVPGRFVVRGIVANPVDFANKSEVTFEDSQGNELISLSSGADRGSRILTGLYFTTDGITISYLDQMKVYIFI